jgi:hypothetical protein
MPDTLAVLKETERYMEHHFMVYVMENFPKRLWEDFRRRPDFCEGMGKALYNLRAVIAEMEKEPQQ